MNKELTPVSREQDDLYLLRTNANEHLLGVSSQLIGDVRSLVALFTLLLLVSYTLGADWDDPAMEFRLEAACYKFEQQFTYSQTTDAENTTKYKVLSVTLHPVPFGNVKTWRIPREEGPL